MSRVDPRFAALLLILASLWWCPTAQADTAAIQTNVDQALHGTDRSGVPHLSIDGVGKVEHPAWTALYALAYAGVEDYDPSLGLKADSRRFEASIAWLKANLVQRKQGLWLWIYDFDSTYNDVSIKAPWSSAFAQAAGIQALLAHWRETRDRGSLELARKAAESLFVPLSQGGLLFSTGDDVWFEEIPSPDENPSHILNGHMRALLALNDLADATGDSRYREWFGKGIDTLLRWLPLYDAGYWLRYDLNPRKEELLFRLANPYGFANPELAIDRIVLRDPVTGEESVLDVGSPNDAEGPLRIAGNDWGQMEKVDGRTVRRLLPVESGREAPGSSGQMVAPHTYFYLTLPGGWRDNLRRERFELTVEYFDEKPGNLEAQIRSIAPGNETFRSLADSALLLSGSGNWRQWKIPLKSRDLGYWVGIGYGRKHAEYLAKLAALDGRLSAWAQTGKAYLGRIDTLSYTEVQPRKRTAPRQTSILPWYSMDARGVLLMHVEQTAGQRDTELAVYSPYIIAAQAIDGPKMDGLEQILRKFSIPPDNVKRKPALDWLLDPENQHRVGNAIVYRFDFLNTYNDVVSKAPWQSSFAQTYVMKALLDAIAEDKGETSRTSEVLARSLDVYGIDIDEGGLAHRDRHGHLFFEEVPNRSHVLNAHLSALPVIDAVSDELNSPTGKVLLKHGLASLYENLHRFDTGYWLRYDQNPRKELLFQLDWLEGESSPLIETITLRAPQFAKATHVAVGGEKAFDGPSHITGVEWSSTTSVDGRQARAFSNGYSIHEETVQGGTRHNVYALMQLPETIFSDYFDVQPHQLVIRYKDVSSGQFAVKIQSINEGNALDFTPLRNAVITTTGDQQWKEAIIEVRPQDMGWYKGPDYQVFEVDQLEQIAKLTGDWFFEQYTERQRYFLEAKTQGNPVIIQPAFKPAMEPISLSVLRSSPTYEGFGFDNALDGDPDNDYVAGIENSGTAYVDLRLSAPVCSGVLEITWESPKNHAGRVSIYRTNADGEGEQELATADAGDGKKLSIPLQAREELQFIRLRFREFSGQPRVLLRLLELKEGTIGPTVADDGVFMPVTDEKNPLTGFGLPITNPIKSLSDSIVGNATGHESIMKLMHSFKEYSVGLPTDASPDGIVKEKVAACGNFTVLLLALAASQGFEGRLINLHNYPESMGHTVAEIYVDGAWRLYDPTFEGYYHYSDDPGRRALSFSEILEGYESGRHITYLFKNRREGIEHFSGREIFMNANPKGIIGTDYPMLFPLSLDAKSLSSVSRKEYGTQFQGAGFLGVSYLNSNHRWKITGLEAGKKYVFSVFPGDIAAPRQDGKKVFEVEARIGDRKIRHGFVSGEPEAWNLEFVATEEFQEITLLHRYTGEQQHYILLDGFSVSESRG